MTERPLDVSTCLSMWKNNFLPAVGVLDEPYSAKPARVAIPVPAYVDWRACTDTALSGVS
jgi:hypothetical protein